MLDCLSVNADFEAESKSFQAALERLLESLAHQAPEVFDQAMCFMPNVAYAPDVLSREHPMGALARADGLFAVDGSDFELFRWLFLHEIGHHVASWRGLGKGEAAANSFADEVVALLDAP